MKRIQRLSHILALAAVLVLSFSLLAGCGSSDAGSAGKKSASNTGTPADKSGTESDGDADAADHDAEGSEDGSDRTSGGKHHAQIEVADYGTITVELDADTAPITVENFINLANEGFYDGLTFMRVVDGFMIQGGDPEKNCTGGSGTTIKGEFSDNGMENNISHVRGTISMARSSNDFDSASSQFFIVHRDSEFLDGSYAAFGTVTDGMDVVDAIVDQTAGDADTTSGLIADESKQAVITTIKITD